MTAAVDPASLAVRRTDDILAGPPCDPYVAAQSLGCADAVDEAGAAIAR